MLRLSQKKGAKDMLELYKDYEGPAGMRSSPSHKIRESWTFLWRDLLPDFRWDANMESPQMLRLVHGGNQGIVGRFLFWIR